MLRKFAKMLKEEKGQALAEYGLILFLIAVVAVLALTTLGTSITTVLGQISGAL